MNIFLAAPMTQYSRASEATRFASFRSHWSGILDALEANGHNVFSAHRREAWGAELDSPADALAVDLAELRESNLVIAYVGNPPSPGVQLELGYAVARQIPMMVFVDAGQPDPYLVRGMPAISDAQLFEIASLSEIQPVLAHAGLIGSECGSSSR